MGSGAQLGQLLRFVQQAQSRAVDVEQFYGLTSAQFAVLAAVVSKPGIDQRAISDVTFLARTMLPAVVQRLAGRELITAVRNPRDARRDHLTPTDSAVALMYEVTPQVVARNEGLLRTLGDDARGLFLDTLEAVGMAERAELPAWHRIPSPDGVRPPLEVPWGLGRLVRAAMQRYGRLWGESITSLTMLQWSALVAVAEGAEIDQRRLGECLRLDKATASVMVSRLSRRGLLERGEDDGDRRRRILHLTRAGRDELVAVSALVPAVDERFLAPAPAEARGCFLEALRTLAAVG
ncbi:MAG TPA: MarR family winged helix-turn-helix transcriptional regulator [Pseudonocardia sp.]|uniref:MarR family winged helix-turn-helix transcriptional regulator n=1 Tax=Pseudonocardia sp. TaxID=60912 RepID=UPI002B4AC953|nr:MarR family winged helix-turn-helix transcriptional regulator [Pseudonocardia sp.]HLU54872.1 MarR family winged helix-turn-helix transcriptional regulator [Pseudonocardia sp.]